MRLLINENHETQPSFVIRLVSGVRIHIMDILSTFRSLYVVMNFRFKEFQADIHDHFGLSSLPRSEFHWGRVGVPER